ncbi:SIMPL domain-containing protein [Sulfitobacter aestuariivivens]|uniref:SIMPL domain-containing protein n=1 Tax=Sulfitobacter aestuariivivens TaxID=2766981 RepID=UPI003612C91B
MQNNRSVSSDQPPQIVGYRAGNTVKVRVRDLAKLGAMLDGVIETGANDFNGLSFGLQNPAPAKARARAAAVADAMERAGELADAAGLALGTVLRMTEHSNVSRPAPMMEMSAPRGSMGDAIATGEVDVTAQVTMVFAIAPGLP